MLDSYTSSMCVDAWGRPSYARAMIEVSAERSLCENITVATPWLDEPAGFTKEVVRVEYEWKPPRCDSCKVFGHDNLTCPHRVKVQSNIPKEMKMGLKKLKNEKIKYQ